LLGDLSFKSGLPSFLFTQSIRATPVHVLSNEGLLLESTHAVMEIHLVSLREQSFKISPVEIFNPNILLSRSPEGRWNWFDETQQKHEGTLWARPRYRDGTRSNTGWNLLADSVRIREGTLIYQEEFHEPAVQFDFNHLNVEAHQPDPYSPWNFKGHANMNPGPSQSFKVSFAGTYHPKESLTYIRIDLEDLKF